jgi:hypothetical protein
MADSISDILLRAHSPLNDGATKSSDGLEPASTLHHEVSNGLTNPGARITTQGTDAHGAPPATVNPNAIDFHGAQQAAPPPPEARSFAGSVLHNAELFGEGVVSASIFNPINGVKQIYDHAAGYEYKPTEFSNQQEVDKSLAGFMGGFVGRSVDFTLLAVATGGVAGAAGLTGTAWATATAVSAGVVDGAVFMPSNDSNWKTGRAGNAAAMAFWGLVSVGSYKLSGRLGPGNAELGTAASAAEKAASDI